MPISIAYWVLLLVWVLFPFMGGGPPSWRPITSNLLITLLLGLLGWHVFGPPIHV